MAESAKTIIDVKEGLNEYFKLKLKYENQIMANKKKIMNNPTLSNREKRMEYRKLKPKCINCKRPGGTLFNIVFLPQTDTTESYREYTAKCGIIADPCPLSIKIQMGKVDLLPKILQSMENDIKMYKNEIIDDKNKLLFGYMKTEEALTKFDDLKDYISHYTSLYESYLQTYNNLVDNDEKIVELNESSTMSYIQIDNIKTCIKKMNETDNVQFAHDAVNIYETTLIPLLAKIRQLKYNECFVWHNEDTNTCNLIQNKYSISNLSYTSFQDNVSEFSIGFDSKKIHKEDKLLQKIQLDSPSSSTEGNEEPIYGEGKDGIAWKNPDYTKIWDRMPLKLKTVLRPNHEWLVSFMANCVTARSNSEPCKFITPPNLNLPPKKLSDGQYDFGVKIYNEVFSKLSQQTRQTYLTLNSVKQGKKDFSLLETAMNNLVAKEVDFDKGYL